MPASLRLGSLEVIWQLLRWSLGFVLLGRLRQPSAVLDYDLFVSVVIPCRNEAANLERLLPSLAGQADEVIVVDDGSTDGTAAVARSYDAAVVEPGDPPDGFLGKPWACAAGASVASGDVLVFLDADVVCEAGAIAAIVGEQRRRGGLVSVQPWHDAREPHEKLAFFPNLVALMTIGGRGAFGPCMAIDRATYDAVDGHAAPDVRGSVVEDIALARRVGRVTTFAGGGLSFRMYPDGIGDLVEGFSKNLASGARAAQPVRVVLFVVWITGAVVAPVAAWWWYLLYTGQLWLLGRRVGRFGPATAATYPIGLAFFTFLTGRSLWLTYVRRSVTWRGRTWAISSRDR